ncbi:MAG: toll/interleukin-1 receptor domain-containing protein [Opitutaceae bacterium]|nr:toll/interleukin-1 receptor domain-containing protein [Opitutaceae bacterium]
MSSPPGSAPPAAVFLSYASEDADAARLICDALRAAGAAVWFDQSELRGGDAWDAKIRRQIRDCALFLPVISSHTQARLEGYYRLEWKLAVDRSHLMADGKVFFVPVVIDETTDGAARVPDKFREVQWTRMSGGEPTPAFVARVQHLLGGPDTEPLRRSAAERGASIAVPAARVARTRWRATAAAIVVVAAVLDERARADPQNLDVRMKLAVTLAWLKDTLRAQRELATIETAWREQLNPDRAWDLASFYAASGDAARAVPLLRQALHQGTGIAPLTVYQLKLDPWWNEIRATPEFQALLADPPPMPPPIEGAKR